MRNFNQFNRNLKSATQLDMDKRNLLLLLLCLVNLTIIHAQETYPIRFSWGIENFRANFKELASQRPSMESEVFNGKYARYIHFNKVLQAKDRASLNNNGVEIVSYVFPATYLLILPNFFDLNELTSFGAQSVQSVKPVWKMAQNLREPPYGDWAVHGDQVDVNLQVYPNISIKMGAEWCRQWGMTVLKEGNQNGFIQVRIKEKDLLDAAALPYIQYLELVSPPGEKEDNRGRALHRSNLLDSDYPMGNKFNGEGVRTLVRDDGQLGPHIDFQGRLYNITNTPVDYGIHGDGVAGIIGGAGNLNPYMKGMAAGADVLAIDYENTFQDQTLDLHLNEGVTITNTSYSEGCNFPYGITSQTVDKQLYEHPTLMHVFSAGNSNNNNCGYGAGNEWGNISGGHKMSKNSIAVANVGQDALLDITSSRGPASDGRLKPDITANGKGQFSTKSYNDYREFGGTSGAAPGIVGCLAQLTQAFKSFHAGEQPNATLLKAVILNSANEIGNIGPDFKFGWGLVNAGRALNLLASNSHLSDEADQGEVKEHVLQIPGGVRLAKFMIAWADSPANPGAGRKLVNDLDLWIITPAGDTLYPWKLDPTPDPVILNTPAGTGRDSLNNVEQVSIFDPVAGDYRVLINGTDIPFGPQEYHLVWDFLKDDVKITYPAGGEGFEPGSTLRIHWDAYDSSTSFTIKASYDDGLTFSDIVTVGGGLRMYDWVLPNVISGNVKLLIVKGMQIDTMDHPFSIAPAPQDLNIDQVCPDYFRLSWTEVNDTLSYDAYMLGGKYMELVGTTDTNTIDIHIQNAGTPRWVSVRTSHANGLHSERAIAIHWPGELKNCTQVQDLGVRTLINPTSGGIISCGASTQDITVNVTNEGSAVVSGAQISYRFNNEPVITESLPDILPGNSQVYTFNTPLSINGDGVANLSIWSSTAGDIANFNDTFSLTLPVITQAITGLFAETFDTSDVLPRGWTIENPDGGYTWDLSNEFNPLIGVDGNPTRCVFMNHFDYETEGAMDYLYMTPIQLTNVNRPVLSFDLAHRQYSSSYIEGLKVEVFPNCNLLAPPVVVYDKLDPELATIPSSQVFYFVTDSSHWKKQSADLQAFKGQSVIVRFVAINDFGNNTFLDNIGIQEHTVAQLLNPPDTICKLDTAMFLANQVTPGTNYAWYFGPISFPSNATGPGPHNVTFGTTGNKSIRLIVTGPLGVDTTFHALTVLPAPSANFNYTTNSLEVLFTNSSNNAESYLWDFGDGNSSKEVNPIHSYDFPGTYTVLLQAINRCDTLSKTVELSLVSGVNDLADQMNIIVTPNPSKGDFWLNIESRKPADLNISLLNAQGKLINNQSLTVGQGQNSLPFEKLNLPKGLYQLVVKSDRGQATFKVIIQ